MKTGRELWTGFITTLTTSLVVLGAVTLAMTEGTVSSSPIVPTKAQSTPTQVPVVAITPLGITPAGVTPVAATQAAPAATLTATPMPSPTTVCPTPKGWRAYTLQAGDTLDSLAASSHITVDRLKKANCLVSNDLLVGTLVYLPAPTPTPTPTQIEAVPSQPVFTNTPMDTATKCGPPSSWVLYSIQLYDTLFELSLATGTSIAEIQSANCMGNSTYLAVGSVIYLPYYPVQHPVPTLPAQPTNTPRPTRTPRPPTSVPTKPPASSPTSAPPTVLPTFHPTSTSIAPTLPPVPTTVPPTPPSVPTPVVPTPVVPTVPVPTPMQPTLLSPTLVTPSSSEN